MARHGVRYPEIMGWLACVILVAVLPHFVGVFGTVQVTVFLIFALVALSLDLIWGICGMLSFGQAALFGVGAYAYGIIGINLGLTIPALVGAMAVSAVLAAVIGYFAFYGRVGSIYFAVITLTITLILSQLLGHTADPKYAVGDAVIGGYNGMTNIPSLALELPWRSPSILGPREFFYAAGGLLLVMLILSRLLVLSHFGRVLIGIRENERRTELLGYDVRWRKLVIFAVSGAIAGLAGGLFAGWGNFVNPEVFSLHQSALVVIWVLVGGRGTLYGAVAGAVVVQLLTNKLGAMGATYITIILGITLVAIVLLFPRGLGPSVGDALRHVWFRTVARRTGPQ